MILFVLEMRPSVKFLSNFIFCKKLYHFQNLYSCQNWYLTNTAPNNLLSDAKLDIYDYFTISATHVKMSLIHFCAILRASLLFTTNWPILANNWMRLHMVAKFSSCKWQVAPSSGQIRNQYKWCWVMVKFRTDPSGAIWWANGRNWLTYTVV